jgi:histone acetyltransferase (RNA polymerase elongator complex component)
MKRVIVPFFIAHQGCPHHCVFCDQRAITGRSGRLPTPAELVRTVREWRQSAGVAAVDVAFYGGSFTALPTDVQARLLAPLQPLRTSGEVRAIRVSTRPDALDRSIVQSLREAGVTLVELGIQSMDDSILTRAGRGHLAAHVEEAFGLLQSGGMDVGAQLMPGLPGDSPERAIDSLRRLLPLRPVMLRIYPAVVLEGTELARLYRIGGYRPLSLEAAVEICKVMLQMAAIAGIPVIRAGLQPTDDLTAAGKVLAGPYHPAFRQLAEGERWFDLLHLLCAGFRGDDELEISVASARLSDVVGQKRINFRRIEGIYPLRLRLHGDPSLGNDDVSIKGRLSITNANLLKDLRYNSSMHAVKEIA